VATIDERGIILTLAQRMALRDRADEAYEKAAEGSEYLEVYRSELAQQHDILNGYLIALEAAGLDVDDYVSKASGLRRLLR
jgi:hypothetical protein